MATTIVSALGAVAFAALALVHFGVRAQAVSQFDCMSFATKTVRGEWTTGRTVEMPLEVITLEGNHCRVTGIYKYGPNTRGVSGGTSPFKGTISASEIVVELSGSTGATFRFEGDVLKGQWKDTKTGETIEGKGSFRVVER